MSKAIVTMVGILAAVLLAGSASAEDGEIEGTTIQSIAEMDGHFVSVTTTVGCSREEDSDGDSVCDNYDNCTEIPNPSQNDTDRDGYGNVCNADFNNDGAVGVADRGFLEQVPLFSRVGEQGYRALVDLDNSGSITMKGHVIFQSLVGTAPGPSGR